MRSPVSLGSSEDLAVGQGVIVAARWVLVAVGLVLALVAPPSAAILRTQVLLILVLAVCNFGLQAQLLRRRRRRSVADHANRPGPIVQVGRDLDDGCRSPGGSATAPHGKGGVWGRRLEAPESAAGTSIPARPPSGRRASSSHGERMPASAQVIP